MHVGLADPAAQYHSMRTEVDDAVRSVLASGRYILGPEVAALEEEIAAACGAAHAVAVNSGTDALLLALRAHGVGPGDEVVTTPFTFVATVEAILHAGARPVFADIDPDTFGLDAEATASRLTPRTRAILPVDLFGQMADRASFERLAGERGLALIWDSAQAIGARLDGRRLGEHTGSCTLSFFPTKNLGACGDGGMVLTNDAAIRDRLLRLRFHGSAGGYLYADVGYCSRLDALQAAILRVKLPHLPGWTEARRRHAARYRELLTRSSAHLPVERPGSYHTYHQFTLRHTERDGLKQFLAARGIDSGIYYPLPLHLQEAFAFLGGRAGDCPQVELASREVLSIPVYPELTGEQLSYVAEAVLAFDEQTGGRATGAAARGAAEG